MKIEAKFEKFTDGGVEYSWYNKGKKIVMWLPRNVVDPAQRIGVPQEFTFYVNTKKEPDDRKELIERIRILESNNNELAQKLQKELNRISLIRSAL